MIFRQVEIKILFQKEAQKVEASVVMHHLFIHDKKRLPRNNRGSLTLKLPILVGRIPALMKPGKKDCYFFQPLLPEAAEISPHLPFAPA